MRIKKLWGYEDVLVDEPEYCLKEMVLYARRACSLHYHNKKKETFLIKFGEFNLDIKQSDGSIVSQRLARGQTITINPGTPHRFWNSSLASCAFLEVSDRNDDADVVRLEPSRLL